MRLNPDKVLIIVNSNPATIDVSLGAATWYAQVRGLTLRTMQFDFGTGADSDQLTCDAGVSANMRISNSENVNGFDSWLISVRDYVIANDIRCVLMSACTPLVVNCKGPSNHTALRLFGGIKYLRNDAYLPSMTDYGSAITTELNESYSGFGVSEFGQFMFPGNKVNVPLMFGRIGRYHFVPRSGVYTNQLAIETLDEVKLIVNNAIAAEAQDNRAQHHIGSVNWRIRGVDGYNYRSESSSVTFAPGETSKNIKIRCYIGHGQAKSFEFAISNAVGADIYTNKVTTNIKFDGSSPTWSLPTYSGSASTQVGVCGSTSVNCMNGDGTADFTIYLNKASDQSITVDFATTPVTAKARGVFLPFGVDTFFNSDATYSLHYLKKLGFSNLSYFVGAAGFAGETGYENEALQIPGFSAEPSAVWNGFTGPFNCFAYFGVAFENTNYSGSSGVEVLFEGVNGAWAYEKTSFGFGALGLLLSKNFSVVCGSLREPGASGIPSHHALLHALMHGYSFAEIVGMFPVSGDTPTNFMVAGDPLYAPYKKSAPEFQVVSIKKI